MKTYFISSDIHGFYSPFIRALEKAGFDENNPEHILLILGDILDRGEEGKKVVSFLRNLPKERRILVRGNHEWLLGELLRRGYPLSRDEHNRTTDTLEQFAFGLEALRTERNNIWRDPSIPSEKKYETYRTLTDKIEERLYKGKAIWDVLSWMEGEEWINYFETPHYVFVHAWVPTSLDENDLPRYDAAWREASQESWDSAMWACPYDYYKKGLWEQELAKGKTLVCGHWHTSDFYNHLDYEYEPQKHLDIKKSNPIYRSDRFPGLIGLDACTALTETFNVLVLQEDEL